MLKQYIVVLQSITSSILCSRQQNGSIISQKALLYKNGDTPNKIDQNDQGQCEKAEFHKFIPDNGRFEVEDYSVITEDGYVLQLFRVRLSKSEREKLSKDLRKNVERPVYFQHGLTDDATYWFANETNTLSFHQINNGFDCWFGNNRGNKFSLTHVNPDITTGDFYDFSFTEMGLYDVVENYRVILSSYFGKNKKIIYIGHSEGTSQMFAALADPKTKDFIRQNTERFIALCPIVYMTQVTDTAYQWASLITSTIYEATNIFHIYQVGAMNCSKYNPQWEALAYRMCKKKKFLCHRYEIFIDSYKKNEKLKDDNSSSGASVKQYAHYGQLIDGSGNVIIKTPTFRPFDYGNTENTQKYGQKTPPEWKLDDWVTPTNLIVGREDDLATVANSNYLFSQFPKELNVTMNIFENWDHNTVINPPDPTEFFELIDNLLG